MYLIIMKTSILYYSIYHVCIYNALCDANVFQFMSMNTIRKSIMIL